MSGVCRRKIKYALGPTKRAVCGCEIPRPIDQRAPSDVGDLAPADKMAEHVARHPLGMAQNGF